MNMTDKKQRAAAKEFAEFWQDKGYEKGESQTFWLTLLSKVLGVAEPEKLIRFEDKVVLDHTSFIDGVIPATHVLIEQKSSDKNLRAGILQSDGSILTPFQQAKRYSAELPYSERPRWIVTCNFQEFLVYDMEKPTDEPEQILLKNLPKEYYRLKFLIDTGDENIKKEMELSIKAGEIVGRLYDALASQYHNPESPETLKSLNELCVRIVFCLYAEDAGLFGEHAAFHDYLQIRAGDAREALLKMFEVLNTKTADRDPYLKEDLASFPYVNGGLFANPRLEVPNIDEAIVHLILEEASESFDWSEISPTIFGAVFESTLNPETRRTGGMHYTSIENIHKVIDPLFLNKLREEFDEIQEVKITKTRNAKLREFQNKIAGLKFFDPACGSGNFLTETYISLRKLENEILQLLYNGQIVLDTGDVIKVSIGQFYGIEINDFAVTVAKTALWIAESQMMKQTEEIVKINLDFFPLKTYANIVEGNALRIDWESVVPKDELDYIMGNPPFVGARLMNATQKDELNAVFGPKWKNSGDLDYVACWYKKCADFIANTKIRCALVSTNSVSQGESVANLWKPLFEDNVHIDFAHRTFRWDSESTQKAKVHCVIIGFSIAPNTNDKIIFDNEHAKTAKNINGYLVDAKNIFVENRSEPICEVSKMNFGSMPNDGGFLLLSEEESEALKSKYPHVNQYIRRIKGSVELIQNKKLFCLWLVGVSPDVVRKIPDIYERVINVKRSRERSKRKETKQAANTPTLFAENRQPTIPYIAIPKVSSEKRKYIPIAFEPPNVIAKDQLFIIPGATLYDFGILISNVHNAWVRAVCGRLKSDYNYSKKIVYNNFPWPTPTDAQKAKIEQTAQAILNARAKYPDCSLADLYDEVTMPPELRKAHQLNDQAVMQAYGFPARMTEGECVAELMKMYQKLAGEEI